MAPGGEVISSGRFAFASASEDVLSFSVVEGVDVFSSKSFTSDLFWYVLTSDASPSIAFFSKNRPE